MKPKQTNHVGHHFYYSKEQLYYSYIEVTLLRRNTAAVAAAATRYVIMSSWETKSQSRDPGGTSFTKLSSLTITPHVAPVWVLDKTSQFETETDVHIKIFFFFIVLKYFSIICPDLSKQRTPVS